jgi:rubredoxin
MTQLRVKCKNCGFEFPADTQMNEVAFEAISIGNNDETCPECKRISVYNKSDYYFK